MKYICLALIASYFCTACSDKASEPSSLGPEKPPAVAQATPSSPVIEAPKKSWDGPLGVEMGLKKEQLEAAGIVLDASKSHGVFVSETAPRPNQSFSAYLYIIGDEAGLCKVAGVTSDIESNGAGDQIKKAFSSLEEALTEKYGKPDRFHFVKHDALFKEDKHWMMALKNEERFHVSSWEGKKGTALPYSLGAIGLEASAKSSLEGRVKLTYEFTNIDDCLSETKKKANASL